MSRVAASDPSRGIPGGATHINSAACLDSSDVELVHLDRSSQPAPLGCDHRAAKLVKDEPGRLIGFDAELPLQLRHSRADASAARRRTRRDIRDSGSRPAIATPRRSDGRRPRRRSGPGTRGCCAGSRGGPPGEARNRTGRSEPDMQACPYPPMPVSGSRSTVPPCVRWWSEPGAVRGLIAANCVDGVRFWRRDCMQRSLACRARIRTGKDRRN